MISKPQNTEIQDRSAVEVLSRAMWGDALSVAAVAPRWAAEIVERLAAAGYAIVPTALWDAKNALACAARHHDATGHTTWCDQILIVRYGERPVT